MTHDQAKEKLEAANFANAQGNYDEAESLASYLLADIETEDYQELRVDAKCLLGTLSCQQTNYRQKISNSKQ